MCVFMLKHNSISSFIACIFFVVALFDVCWRMEFSSIASLYGMVWKREGMNANSSKNNYIKMKHLIIKKKTFVCTHDCLTLCWNKLLFRQAGTHNILYCCVCSRIAVLPYQIEKSTISHINLCTSDRDLKSWYFSFFYFLF